MIDWIRARGPRPLQHYVDLEIVRDTVPRPWLP
jgi:hypothetical protein